MSFEESLVTHASPTLASIKVANLYNFKFSSMKECESSVKHFNSIMNAKGIFIEFMKIQRGTYLIYVYRESQLKRLLKDPGVVEFLRQYGYMELETVEDYVAILKSRLYSEEKFPHEIGVFLGYPLADVKSFIKSKGKNFLACGDWKVYHDVATAKCQFCKYKRCREIYIKVYKTGRRIKDMLVSA